ncbi:Xanthine dehydrogenase/oxidase [Holothuria leucospilota]|uniref:Xanthine dehydrogenase/oxidase n=1 Tax=Holothuria leucospilota TaxID=206669 RepID=A0A9Q1CHA0_HOLLE|nr:Xanthine dehydrogenase/oxidase [Holothuria leucospilota]
MLSSLNQATRTVSHTAVNACLIPICSVYGKAVTTVEGIGSVKKIHPVQERIAKAHGSQCGFCTPGFVMSMYTLLRSNPVPTMAEIEAALEGNLCRCTAYRPIVEGFRSFSKGCCQGQTDQCCQSPVVKDERDRSLSSELFRSQEFAPYDPTQDVIFPPELLLMANRPKSQDCLLFQSEKATWLQPFSLDSLLKLKGAYPSGKIVAGNTDIGVEVRYQDKDYPLLINAQQIPELKQLTCDQYGVHVGAAVTVSRLTAFLKQQVKLQSDHKTRVFEGVIEMLSWFGGAQIRNVASIGGNVISASPVSDFGPLLMASGSTLHVASEKGTRTLTVDETFLCGYKQTSLRDNEILTAVNIPYTTEDEYFFSFKQSGRKEDPYGVVKASMMVAFQPNTNIVKELRIAFGGVANTVVMAKETMRQLRGKIWNDGLLATANKTLLEDIPITPGAPGGFEKYRQSLALGFFFKFYLRILENLINSKMLAEVQPIPETWKSAAVELTKRSFKSTQLFQEVPSSQEDVDPVGRPLVTLSSIQQATGEVRYLDDIPFEEDELCLALVFSTCAHANIRSIDFESALSVEGVCDVVSAQDVPGNNWAGLKVTDEELFASEKVNCAGQVIAGVVAKDQVTARNAAKLVKVEYEELEPILTIQDAVEKGSFLADPIILMDGDAERALKEADHVIQGEVSTGGQEHFYMETQRCRVKPLGEHKEIEVDVSSQALSLVQDAVVKALGIPGNRVICKAKRIGGGFGGKAYRTSIIAAITAVAAVKSGNPVRLVLDRHEDMICSGGRHPYLVQYKVGFTKEGKLTAADITFYSNGGYSLDASASVMITTLLKFENGYKIPNVKVTGICCKTNLPSFTAFRAFGAPQGILSTETWMTEIAHVCGISQEQVREINFYKEGDATHHSQRLLGVTLSRCWEECLSQSDFATRRTNVDNFNKTNRWKKRGLAIIPIKYGISFISIVRFLNQSGALVQVYKDGSVLLSHGGIEMGQGLYTKMIQVASRTLGISAEKIHTSETSTDKVPNTPGTAASTGSDLNGMAVKQACEKILHQLKPVIEKNPNGSWEEWVLAAYLARISLSATGFYMTPDLDYDMEKNQGRSFNYFCYGAAASEVEIDCLTGNHVVLRTDIVMDVGDSINPAVDIGQVEGGFMQGYGLFLTEDYRYSPDGHLLTKGPCAYKMPTVKNIPAEFNVSLLHNASNPRAICSSKAVGEPPVILSTSVFFAVKDAIKSARSDANLPINFRLDAPAVPERIRLACQDFLTEKIPEPKDATYVPYHIRP